MRIPAYNADEVVFMSDTHFGHANIIQYCNRPFSNVDEMDLTMLSAIQDADNSGKTIIHLGDFVLNPKTLLSVEWRPKGNHIILLGNHDTRANSGGKYRKLYREFFTEIIGHSDNWKTTYISVHVGTHMLLLSHEPQQQLVFHDYNLYGHHHNNMQRYPSRFQPSYNWLFDSNKHINVGVELTNYKPISLPDAINLIPPIQ